VKKPSSRQKIGLTREDIELWAHVTRSVVPMPGRPVLAADIVAEPAPLRTSEITAPAPLPASRSPRAAPPLQPLERRLRQRLSRGQYAVDGVIDLHGMRQSEAHGALIAFLGRAHREGRLLVLVVTGKGSSAEPSDREGRGVLKRLVPHWLADPVLRRMIVGFEDAARGHGGSGALYVRLRKPHRT